MGKEEQLLSMSIGDSILDASKYVDKVSLILEGFISVDDAEREISALEEAKDTLRWYIEKLYQEVALLAERMAAPLTAQRIFAEFDESKKGDLAHLEAIPDDIGLTSHHLNRIRRYFNSLSVMTTGTKVTGLDVFRNILENTPAIIELTGKTPDKESVVQQEVFKVLQIAFPDAVRELSIGHLMKTYKPDLGVRSLMAAAEYKFAATEAEVRHALDGIYTDMKGYSGHYEWRTFFAVIYTTDAIVNPKRLEAEFKGVKADANWTPIVVVGKGNRSAPKSRKAKHQP